MKKKSDPISRSQALLCIPEKHDQINETILDSGELLLTYKVAVRPFLAKFQTFFTRTPVKPLTRKIQLDLLGKSVWSMLDGKRTVKDVIGKFAQTHQVNRKEAEVSVTLFLKSLGRKGLIGLKEPGN